MLAVCFGILRKLKGVTPDALGPGDVHPAAGVYCSQIDLPVYPQTFCREWCRYTSFGKKVGYKCPCSNVIRACPLDHPGYSLFSIGMNCTDVQEQLDLLHVKARPRDVWVMQKKHITKETFLGSLALATVPWIFFANWQFLASERSPLVFVFSWL